MACGCNRLKGQPLALVLHSKTIIERRRKWDAWRSHKMKPQISAMLEYVSYLNAIIDSRIGEGMATTNPRSVDATHMGLSVSRARPKARDVDKLQTRRLLILDLMKQHRLVIDGDHLLLAGLLRRTEEHPSITQVDFQHSESAKFDKIALAELQQSRPNTLYAAPENIVKGTSDPSGALNDDLSKKSNLSPSRLYDHTTDGHTPNHEQSSTHRRHNSHLFFYRVVLVLLAKPFLAQVVAPWS